MSILNHFFDYKPEVLALDEKAMELCQPYFRHMEEIRDFNQLKMLKAFADTQMSSTDMLGTTGYGLWDTGRAKLEQIFAEVMGAEDALVRSQFQSGTHTLAVALFGLLRAGDTLLAARAALHHWEEPCLSGDPNATTGSGTVFFTGCTLQCCYCQNYKISQQGLGKPLTAERLAEIFMELQQKGAKNLNLVTATQWLPWVTQALDAARRNGLTLPVAYNTGGYETVETVKALAGYVDIWLADYKYASPALAKELSAAQDYPQVAHAAIRQMLLQTGAPVYDADGYLQKGVIVRHLALPGHSDDSLAVLQRLADLRQETGVSFVPSLMSQFTPFYRAAEHGLGRRITTYEYRKVVDRAIVLGLTDGYMQEKSSAREEYTPPFDLEGV